MSNPNHYPNKKISEINPENDFKVRVMGFLVDKKGDTLVIDDGSGKIQIFVDKPDIISEKLELNQLIRVFGSIVPIDEGFEIKADIIHKMSNFDINLYKKTEELYNRVGV